MLMENAAYFDALRSALDKARRSVVLLGWQFDPRTHLDPETRPTDRQAEIGGAGDADRHGHIHAGDRDSVDLIAQIAFTQGLIGHMAERGSGALGFISSIAGKVGVPMRTAYSAAKFGLAGYADALRGELSQSGVAVHTIFPGSIRTDVSRNALTADGTARGKSDQAIDEGLDPDVAAAQMLDAIAAGQREIIVAQGSELAMGESRRTPDTLFDQVAAMVARGYMDKLKEG